MTTIYHSSCITERALWCRKCTSRIVYFTLAIRLIKYMSSWPFMNNRSFRKGVPELRGMALICLSAIDQKIVYWSSPWARIFNILDVYYLLPPLLSLLANIHSKLAYDVPDTEDVGLPTVCDAGQHYSYQNPLSS